MFIEQGHHDMPTDKNTTTEQTKQQVSVAAMTPDHSVEPPSRARPASFTTQVAALEIGECVSKVERLDMTLPAGTIQDCLTDWRSTVRNNCAPSVRHAKAKTGGTYTIEVFDCMSESRNWYLMAVVTRQS